MTAYGATCQENAQVVTADTAVLPEEVLRLAGRGFRLFPVEPRGKRPLILKWQDKATCDVETLLVWAGQHPGCNWGLACGPDSGVFVLDVDGDKGAAAICELCSTFGEEWMDTLIATTARGRHLYYQCPEGAEIRNSASKLAPGLDVRGAGGYVIVPPSVHPSGHEYNWVCEDAPVAPAPAWLLERLSAPARKSTPISDHNIPKGGRNASLTSLAGTMQRRGVTREAIEAALLSGQCATLHTSAARSRSAPDRG